MYNVYFQDKDFGKQAIFRAHVNPPASVVTTIKAYQKYFLKKAYIGEDVFWGLSPSEGDTVEFRFDPAIEIERFVFAIFNVFLFKTSGKHVRAVNTPLKPQFHIVEMGLAGVYLFLIQNIDCGYSLERTHQGGSNVYLQSMF